MQGRETVTIGKKHYEQLIGHQKETVTIAKIVYDQLCEDSDQLGALEANDVRSWEGYEKALSPFRKACAGSGKGSSGYLT